MNRIQLLIHHPGTCIADAFRLHLAWSRFDLTRRQLHRNVWLTGQEYARMSVVVNTVNATLCGGSVERDVSIPPLSSLGCII